MKNSEKMHLKNKIVNDLEFLLSESRWDMDDRDVEKIEDLINVFRSAYIRSDLI